MSYTKKGVRCDANTVTDDDIRAFLDRPKSQHNVKTNEIALYALYGTQSHVRMLCRGHIAELVNIGNGIFDD